MSRTAIDQEDGIGVAVNGTSNSDQKITLSHDKALQSIFGTNDPDLARGLMQHCLKVLKSDEASDDLPGHDERLFMLTSVAEIKPRDTFERMLSIQMAATHVALIRAGRWLAHAENVAQVQAHYSGYTKLARSFAAQMETLRKNRNGGKQTVTVHHVNVADGGQAIVGPVAAGGRADDER